jgi:hypothetical protein
MFQSKLISRGAKPKLYWSVVRPVVTYACETWVLKESEINELLGFERKILRKFFGPSKENDSWRMKTNEELNQLINHKSIINFIRAQRLSWLGHVERMSPNKSAKSLYLWKPLGARTVGRPKTRWEGDVKADIKKMKVPNWKTTVQDRTKWTVWLRRPKLYVSCSVKEEEEEYSPLTRYLYIKIEFHI